MGRVTKNRGDFILYKSWIQNVITEDVILCHASALECLDMFSGYIYEPTIDVYAKKKGIYTNINYFIVDSFDSISYCECTLPFGEMTIIPGHKEYLPPTRIFCTTFEQTVNDMLRDIDNADDVALTEALSNYYFSHNESFENLKIDEDNVKTFEKIKLGAIAYYSGG